jgi:iron only hydrogenase large subunit-like protein
MEAAVRTAYFYITGENPPPAVVDLKPVRGLAGIKDATLNVPGIGEIRVAVVSGTANAKRLLEKVKSGESKWHFIEFMACPGGCISGGGQPKSALPPSDVVKAARTGALYNIDERSTIRLSHENSQIKGLYDDYLGKPCEGLAHELLHTHHYDKERSKRFTSKK